MKILPILCLVGVLASVGCKTNMPSYEAGNTNSARKVLVASEDTGFKRRVVARVIERLGTRDWYFKVIGLDQLPAEQTGQYGAILLGTEIQGGVLEKRAAEYLKLDPANGKVVLFYTRGMEGAVPENARLDLNVDAVSSASRQDREETRAEELAALIRQRF